MLCCKVHVPFIDKETGELYKANTEIILSERRVEEVKSVNQNFISIVCVAVGTEKPKKGKKKAE